MDCLVVKNGSERIPVSTDLEGIKRLVDIHGADNVLNMDGSPYPLVAMTMETIKLVPESFSASVPEAVDNEDKPKRKTK